MEAGRHNKLATSEKRELADPFPGVRRLFAFAKAHTHERSRYDYGGEGGRVTQKSEGIPLPEEFLPLVAQYPDKYFVISCEDRKSEYYAPGTRFVEVLLSTVSRRGESDGRIREISFREHDASEGKGNAIFMTVSESVHEASFLSVNEQLGVDEGNKSRPHGHMRTVSQVDVRGNTKVIEQDFERLDEGIFDWEGSPKRIRWFRSLRADLADGGGLSFVYRDTYLVGLKKEGGSEGLSVVEIRVHPDKAIEVGIGSSAIGHGTLLYADEKEDIRIYEDDTVSQKHSIDRMDILRKDPNYAFLFERPISKASTLTLLMQKINGLRDDWDKPDVVFSQKPVSVGTEKDTPRPLLGRE
jgi:hypothetical protein